MLFIGPICLWFSAILYFAPTVEINEKEIVRTLFFTKKV